MTFHPLWFFLSIQVFLDRLGYILVTVASGSIIDCVTLSWTDLELCHILTELRNQRKLDRHVGYEQSLQATTCLNVLWYVSDSKWRMKVWPFFSFCRHSPQCQGCRSGPSALCPGHCGVRSWYLWIGQGELVGAWNPILPAFHFASRRARYV